MAPGRRRGGRPAGPKAGSILTGTVVAHAKRGVVVELGATELLLPRSRYGAAADQIEASGYGDPLTVEVVADPSHPAGVGLTRVAIERSMRQPRPIEGRLVRSGSGTSLEPSDGSGPFPVVLLDRAEVEAVVGTSGRWLVGAPHRDRRFALLDPQSGPLA